MAFSNLIDAPDAVSALGSAMTASASFVAKFANLAAAEAALYYPDAPENTTGVWAVLSAEAGRRFKVELYADALSVGELQDLGQAVAFELMSRYRTTAAGLVIVDEPEVGDVMEPDDEDAAAEATFLAIEISGTYGITLG